MIQSTRQRYFNLNQTAQYLGMGLSTVKRDWPSFSKYGVVPSRVGKRTLRFDKEQLDRMMERLKVTHV